MNHKILKIHALHHELPVVKSQPDPQYMYASLILNRPTFLFQIGQSRMHPFQKDPVPECYRLDESLMGLLKINGLFLILRVHSFSFDSGENKEKNKDFVLFLSACLILENFG